MTLVTHEAESSRSRRPWPQDVLKKVKRLWMAGATASDIAQRFAVDGLFITAAQVKIIIAYHGFRGPRSKPVHSKEFIARIRSLWEDGWSAGRIAANVRSLSRNAVIGLAYRHGFERKTDKRVTLYDQCR